MSPRESYYLPERRLVSQDNAAIIERSRVPRSKFTGSFTRKTAFSAGYLVPFMLDEVLPGDHMTYNVTAYVRMATPLFPIFDNQDVCTFFFFVPARILWTNWVKFMGEQASPSDSIAYTVPTINLGTTDLQPNTIYDHFGLPVNMAGGASIDVNSLPLRAYNRIWQDWFRDQNVDNALNIRTGDTGDLPGDYTLARRRKAHDYFTSALPWPQKFTAPSIALVGNAPISGLGNLATYDVAPQNNVKQTPPLVTSDYPFASLSSGTSIAMRVSETGVPDVYADLSQATGVAINTLRQSFMIQQLLERDARGGTRYVELIRSHFDVINPDFRVQRPEYIGGGKTPLNITPIAQTAPNSDDTGLGSLGGAGTAAGQHRASYAATEHGYIIGLINTRTELSYQQGLHRMWTRSTRYDFYWPSLAELGEQAIYRQEIYCTGDGESDGTVFGYQERWHEYRTRYSDITGLMRSDFAGTLDAWHLAQHFASAPTLSGTFLRDEPPMARVLVAAEQAINQHYLADILIQRTAVRPIPTFGTPANLGRF